MQKWHLKPINGLIKKFSNIDRFCNGDINKFVLLLRKGVYPYEYMDNWERFDETSLPDKKSFCSELNLEGIIDKDYTHAQKVFEVLKFKNVGDYHDVYVQSDTLLLADVLENCRNNGNGLLWTWSRSFLSSPELAWQTCLKKTGLELELLTDIDMLLMVEKELGAECAMQCIDMQKQIINIWKITINALNQYFLLFRCKQLVSKIGECLKNCLKMVLNG